MRTRRFDFPLRTATVCILLTGALIACTGDAGSPEDSAETLADALADGDVADVTFDGTSGENAQAELKKIVSGMDGSSADITVGDVEEDGDTATAQLDVTWTLGNGDDGAEWSYESEATLQKSGDEWQPEWSHDLLVDDLDDGETLSLSRTSGDRGAIVGAGGEKIVQNRPVVRVGIDKANVSGNAKQAARQLASLVEVDAQDYVSQVDSYGPDAFVEAIVLRKEDASDLNAAAFGRIDGALQVPDTMSLAPTREFASALLGTVGDATAELIKESDGELAPGDEAGLSGLQERYDERLRGQPGLTVQASGKSGEDRELFATDPKSGTALETTLDLSAQKAAENALRNVTSPSGVVAIEPSTGNIVAAASGPGSDGYSTATVGQYAPGSTFKVVTSLAMLRNGYSPGDTLRCSPTTSVDGKSFKNYDDYPASALGQIPMRTAIAESCNTALIGEQADVPQKALADAAASLGLGEDHDTGFSSYFGEVARKAPATEHAASMIGQGKVQASPMAMAVVAASVANGSTVVPTLVKDHDAEKPSPNVALKKNEAATLDKLMRGVVQNGSGAFLSDVPGGPVGAKTGTAEYGDGSQTHAWMIGTRGDLAVAAFVENGESGSATAGPVLEQFLRSYN